MSRKNIFLGVGAVLLVVVGAVGWWLLSPLFLNQTVDEALPFSVNAQVPPDMEPMEVEMVMSGMAKVDLPVEEAMPQMMAGPSESPTAVKTGTFRDADNFHRGSGTAAIYQSPEGAHLLRLEDFSVTNGPDLRVLLAGHPDPQNRDDVQGPGYIELGSLKGNIGNQNYEIPEGTDIGAQGSVVIYCKPFQVVFSVASLK